MITCFKVFHVFYALCLGNIICAKCLYYPIFKTPNPLIYLSPKIFQPLDLGRPISNEVPSPNGNQSIQIKHNPRMTLICYQVLPSAFVFSIKSLISSSFHLTLFHLAEASLSALSWLYTLVCKVVQKYHEMFFTYNHF